MVTVSFLAGAEMINMGVIVIRYFGGIKLGTGGLVKAYSDAVNLALQSSELKDFVKLEYKKLIVEYSELSQIEYYLSKYKNQKKRKFSKCSKSLKHHLLFFLCLFLYKNEYIIFILYFVKRRIGWW